MTRPTANLTQIRPPVLQRHLTFGELLDDQRHVRPDGWQVRLASRMFASLTGEPFFGLVLHTITITDPAGQAVDIHTTFTPDDEVWGGLRDPLAAHYKQNFSLIPLIALTPGQDLTGEMLGVDDVYAINLSQVFSTRLWVDLGWRSVRLAHAAAQDPPSLDDPRSPWPTHDVRALTLRYGLDGRTLTGGGAVAGWLRDQEMLGHYSIPYEARCLDVSIGELRGIDPQTMLRARDLDMRLIDILEAHQSGQDLAAIVDTLHALQGMHRHLGYVTA